MMNRRPCATRSAINAAKVFMKETLGTSGTTIEPPSEIIVMPEFFMLLCYTIGYGSDDYNSKSALQRTQTSGGRVHCFRCNPGQRWQRYSCSRSFESTQRPSAYEWIKYGNSSASFLPSIKPSYAPSSAL